MILNQFGRRNLINYQRSVLALEIESVYSERAKEKQREAGGAVPQTSAKAPVETYFRLALKAQSQCRATLETLSTIKNPPVIFAKQANISTGNQQINNAVSTSRTENNKKQQNELLTEIPHAKLDTRRTVEAIPVNSELATME